MVVVVVVITTLLDQPELCQIRAMESRDGIEPTMDRVAACRLTIWLPRHVAPGAGFEPAASGLTVPLPLLEGPPGICVRLSGLSRLFGPQSPGGVFHGTPNGSRTRFLQLERLVT